MLNTKRLVICCSFRTISSTNINIYRNTASLVSNARAILLFVPPARCFSTESGDNSRRPRFQEVQRRRRYDCTNHFTHFTGKNSFSFWMTIKTKKSVLYQNIVLPPCLTLATVLLTHNGGKEFAHTSGIILDAGRRPTASIIKGGQYPLSLYNFYD